MLNPTRMLAFLDEKIRSLGTAACPPYHLAVVIGGTSAEFALKTAKYASAHYLDHLPTSGIDGRARLPRPRARGAGLQAHPVVRDRRAVRRQVLLPRRPRGPAAAARRLLPGRDRGLVLGRPAGARQDHRRGRLPRAARDRPGAVPARHHRGPPDRGRRGGRDRPQPADGRDPRRAVRAPGQDPALPDRSAGGRPRHRARQDQGAARRRRADAGVPARPPGLLRRPGQDARRAWRRARSARRRPAGWTPTSSSSRPPAARW